MKAEKPKLTLCQKDFDLIMSLMSVNATEAMEILEEEISDAHVIDGEVPPENAVGLNSTVEILDLDKDTQSSFQLVLPKDANADEGKVSILTPMGMAVIGLSVGQQYKWPMPNGNIKNFKIVNVKWA